MKRLTWLAILGALLTAWDAAERALARITDRLARRIFGRIDRDWVHAAAAVARREMWS